MKPIKEIWDKTYSLFGLKLVSPGIDSIWIINSHTNNRINSLSLKLLNIILIRRNMFACTNSCVCTLRVTHSQNIKKKNTQVICFSFQTISFPITKEVKKLKKICQVNLLGVQRWLLFCPATSNWRRGKKKTLVIEKKNGIWNLESGIEKEETLKMSLIGVVEKLEETPSSHVRAFWRETFDAAESMSVPVAIFA